VTKGVAPPRLYHATPLRNWDSIRERGLIPGRESHPHLPHLGVYLTHQVATALNYAEMNFGNEDADEPWAIIEVDGALLDPGLLRADDGHETLANLDDIVARGYAADAVVAGDFPWWVSLEETGQVVYAANIPPGALTLEREVVRDAGPGYR
jgi:hypothetical protein